MRGVLADLVLGRQGYLGLKRRLLRAGPRFLWQVVGGGVGPRKQLEVAAEAINRATRE